MIEVNGITIDTTDSTFDWYVDDAGSLHPIALATVRCYRREGGDLPIIVRDGVAYTAPGRYCGNMHRCDGPHDWRDLGDEMIGKVVPQ